MNATQKFDVVDAWHRQLPNGTWIGMIERVHLGEDDVTGSGIAMLRKRCDMIRYIGRTFKCRVNFVFRMPPLSLVSNILTLSFQAKVWIFGGALLLLMFLMLKYMFIAEAKLTQGEKQNMNNALSLQGWSSTSLFLVGSLCQQGVEKEPETIAGRIGTIFVLLVMLFMYTSYSANIVVLLQGTASGLDTVEEFLQSPIKVGFLDFEFSRTMFINSSHPIRKLIFEKKSGPNEFYSYAKGVEKIRNDFFAFYGEPGLIYDSVSKTYEEYEKCDFKEIFTPGEISSIFHATPHKSPYIEIFRTGLIRLEETGLQQKFESRYYSPQPKCGISNAKFVEVGATEIYFAFQVLFCVDIVWLLAAKDALS
ncbi:glutamate receptor 1-like [Chrysoperla carnea]|uniref:glutamate receptor 1-like n=1 Tax=Chrysoperla carnea TaxID=189513 RepID=UPI001D06AC77|nr:glutamate receptor 1-like [Chrysoperla carnea]